MSRIKRLKIYIEHTKINFSTKETLEYLTDDGWQELKQQTSWMKRIFSPTLRFVFKSTKNPLDDSRVHLFAVAMFHENQSSISIPFWAKIKSSKKEYWHTYYDSITDFSQHETIIEQFKELRLAQDIIFDRLRQQKIMLAYLAQHL